jgi:transposase-like protein
LNAFSVVLVPKFFVTDREVALTKALTTVFHSAHNLLCVWHVNTNVLANCKKSEWDANTFDDFMSDWNHVLNSNQIDLFHLFWDAFIQKWNRSHMAAVEYLTQIWLIHKETIIRC